MSLSFSPSIILMDEPFDNVDQGRRLKLLDIIKKSSADIIINTHEFDLLNRLEDKKGLRFGTGKVSGTAVSACRQCCENGRCKDHGL